MALGMDWRLVEERFEELSRHRGLLPTIEAQRRIVAMLREDPGLVDVERGVSHVSLRFGYPDALAFVLVGWTEENGYSVSIWEPSGDVRHRVLVAAHDVPAVIRRYLRQLRGNSD
jgi:hypothetical protein